MESDPVGAAASSAQRGVLQGCSRLWFHCSINLPELCTGQEEVLKHLVIQSAVREDEINWEIFTFRGKIVEKSDFVSCTNAPESLAVASLVVYQSTSAETDDLGMKTSLYPPKSEA